MSNSMSNSTPFTFLVLGEGGTPLYTLPKQEEKKTNLLTSLVSASGGLTKRISGESEILYLESGGMHLLRKKIEGLSFVLIAPKQVEKSSAKETLNTLANKFTERYGTNLTHIQGKMARGSLDLSEFDRVATTTFTEKIGASAYFQFKEALQNLRSTLCREDIRSSGAEKYFTQVQVPILQDSRLLEKEKDSKTREILALCNGEQSTQEIAQNLDLSRVKVMQVLSKYRKQGKIEFTTEFRLSV